jgi:hypothetical protein
MADSPCCCWFKQLDCIELAVCRFKTAKLLDEDFFFEEMVPKSILVTQEQTPCGRLPASISQACYLGAPYAYTLGLAFRSLVAKLYSSTPLRLRGTEGLS